MLMLFFFSLIICSSSYQLWKNPSKLWFPLIKLEEIPNNHATKTTFLNTPLCIYKNRNKITVISDVCPHRGASLSKGRLLKNSKGESMISCPYHGIHFHEGIIDCTSCTSSVTKHQKIKIMNIPSKIHTSTNTVYIQPNSDLNKNIENNFAENIIDVP